MGGQTTVEIEAIREAEHDGRNREPARGSQP
jgi:hypothetical protein